jgi:transcriptional regulator with XRE-family HTH domain
MTYKPDWSQPFTIGRYICERRHEMRLTQATLAERSDLTPRVVRLIEQNVIRPNPDRLLALCMACDMRPAEAFRCAQYSGADELPDALQEPARQLTELDRRDLQRYVDILMGRAPS